MMGSMTGHLIYGIVRSWLQRKCLGPVRTWILSGEKCLGEILSKILPCENV